MVGRVNPDIACWMQDREIAFTINAPAGFTGRIRLHMYYNPDFSSEFCWQEAFFDGESIGIKRVQFCRSEYWDEGIWAERELEISADGSPIEICITARGRLAAGLSAVELVSYQRGRYYIHPLSTAKF
jgi:hypothetical protein